MTASGRHRATNAEAPPAVLRGILTLSLSKPTKIKSIEVNFSGLVKTEWPEGIGSRRVQIIEEDKIFDTSAVFYRASEHSDMANTRRVASLGPGIQVDHESPLATARGDGNGEQPGTRGKNSSRSMTPERPRRPPRGVSVDQAGMLQDHQGYTAARLASTTLETPELISVELPTAFPHPSDPKQTLEDLRNILRAETERNVRTPNPHLHIRSGGSPVASSSHLIVSPTRPPVSRSPSFVRSETSGTVSSSASMISSYPESRRNSINDDGPLVSSPTREEFYQAQPPSPSLRRPPLAQSAGRASPLRRSSATPVIPEADATFSSPSLSTTGISNLHPRSPSRGRQKRFSFGAAWQEMKEKVLPVRHNSPELDTIRYPGRGGAGSSRSRPRSAGEKLSPIVTLSEIEETSRGRNRAIIGKRGAFHVMEHNDEVYTEFKRGIYNWPISFTIPSDTPPTLQCEYGSVSYKLRAHVARPGALRPDFTNTTEIQLVACPRDDDTEDIESIIVEREWDNQLRYLITLSGKSFPMGSHIPLQLTLMPLSKVSIYRLGVFLEEKVDYYAHGRRVSRHDPVHRFELLNIKLSDKHTPLLPVLSESNEVTSAWPLVPFIEADDPSSAIQHLLNPMGPWSFQFSLRIPDCKSKLHFTNKHSKAKIVVSHLVRIVMRVGRLDEDSPDSKKKQFDIIIESPITILSCRCKTEWVSLPSYSITPVDHGENASTCVCHPARRLIEGASSPSRHLQSYFVSPPVTPRATERPLPETQHPRTSNSGVPTDGFQERGRQFARLVAGGENLDGQSPPSYDVALSSPHTPLLSFGNPPYSFGEHGNV